MSGMQTCHRGSELCDRGRIDDRDVTAAEDGACRSLRGGSVRRRSHNDKSRVRRACQSKGESTSPDIRQCRVCGERPAELNILAGLIAGDNGGSGKDAERVRPGDAAVASPSPISVFVPAPFEIRRSAPLPPRRTSLPSPLTRRLLAVLPLRSSEKAEPIRSSMPFRRSPAASPPAPVVAPPVTAVN